MLLWRRFACGAELAAPLPQAAVESSVITASPNTPRTIRLRDTPDANRNPNAGSINQPNGADFLDVARDPVPKVSVVVAPFGPGVIVDDKNVQLMFAGRFEQLKDTGELYVPSVEATRRVTLAVDPRDTRIETGLTATVQSGVVD